MAKSSLVVDTCETCTKMVQMTENVKLVMFCQNSKILMLVSYFLTDSVKIEYLVV